MLQQVFLNTSKFPREINAFSFPSRKKDTVYFTFYEQAFTTDHGRGAPEKTNRQAFCPVHFLANRSINFPFF
jgi:hypothetical protein